MIHLQNNRIEVLRAMLVGKQIDALLVTNSFNITYLTGFTTLAPYEREAFVLVTRRNVYLFSDGRYENKCQNLNVKYQNSSTNLQFRLLSANNNLINHIRAIIKEENIKILGFEREDLKWSEYESITSGLKNTLFPMDRIIIQNRAVKDEIEMKCIENACKINDQSLIELIPYIKYGKSEKEIAFLFETIVKNKGYELSFDPIVAVDKNSSIPHYNTKTGGGIIQQNSIVLIDCGVKYKGYCSDMTRTFFVGKISDTLRKTYTVLQKTQQQTIDQIKEGGTFFDIDQYCRKQIADGGLSDYPHSTGHGVGLEVHEYPKVSTFSTEKVTQNNTFTIEPGVYYSGQWGMRIEDTICLDNKGNGTVLTQFSKEIMLL